MKKLTQVIASAVFASVVGVGSISYAQDDHPGFATVVRVQGIASYNLGDGMWHPLVAGKALAAGSTIRTGENGTVDIILGKKIPFPQSQGIPSRISPAPDAAVRGFISDVPSAQQNAIRLTPGSEMAIDKLSINDTGADTVSDTELNLSKGRLFGSVKKLSAASQYLVKIPNGIAGIRGTEFELGADDSVACYSSESGGLTLVLYVNGQTITFNVTPGQMVEPGTISGSNGSSPGTQPITDPIMTLLSNVFKTLNSTYNVVVNYDYNDNSLYISSVTGDGYKKISKPPVY